MTADELEKEFELIQSRTPKQKVFVGKKGGSSFGVEKKIYPKQVVIKTIGKGLNSHGVKAVLSYILKSAESQMFENEKGEKQDKKNIYDDWKKNFRENKNGTQSKEAMHLVFSIDEDVNLKNLDALEKSVREVLSNNLYEYKYIFALHTHQNKPHVHVVLNKRNVVTGKKLHFKSKKNCKDFFSQMREDFKDALNHYNKEFFYENKFKVDRNLEINMLDEYIEKLNKEDYIFKTFSRDANKNIKRFEKELSNNKITITERFKKISLMTSLPFALFNSDKQKINSKLREYERLKRKENFLKKRERDQNILFEKLEEFKTSDQELIQKIKLIKYLELPSQKKLLTRSQRSALNKIKKSFDLAKYNYANKISAALKKESSDLDGMTKRTNGYKILKLLREVDKRVAVEELLDGDIKNIELLEKNREFLISILKKRFLLNEKNLFKLEREVRAIDKQKDREAHLISIDFLRREQKIIYDGYDKTLGSLIIERREEEIELIKKVLHVELPDEKDVEEFLKEYRPQFEKKQEELLEKKVKLFEKELNIKKGEMGSQEFVDKNSVRYKYNQQLMRAKKIIKFLKLDIDASLMSTKNLNEFLEKNNETYKNIVRDSVEKFVKKVADENGIDLPKDLKEKSNKDLSEWIEKNNVRSSSRKYLELLVENKLQEVQKVLDKEIEKDFDEKKSSQAIALDKKIENLEKLLEKSENISPVFINDIKLVDEKLAIEIQKNNFTKDFILNVECVEYKDEIVSEMKKVLPNLLIEDREKVSKYLYILEKEIREPISKSYLIKNGFMRFDYFKNLKFELFEKKVPVVSMSKVEKIFENECQKIGKNIAIKKDLHKVEKDFGISR